MTKQEFLDGIDRAHKHLSIECRGRRVGICYMMDSFFYDEYIHMTKVRIDFCKNFGPGALDKEWKNAWWLHSDYESVTTILTRRLFYLEMFKEWALCYESYKEY